MQEVIRWPGPIAFWMDNITAKLIETNYYFQSWSQPPYFTTQIVDCIVMPAQAIKILSCRIMINTRTGTTTNPCQFTLCIIDTNTGYIINQLPTVPTVLDPSDPSLFPLLGWQTVYQAIPVSSAPVVNTGEYLGIVFTGISGTKTASNDLRVTPLFEVLIEN